MKIQLALKHLHTVGKHRREVRRLCFKCGLYWQGLVHDLSKYSLVEFIPQIKYWTGKRSPIDEEIDDIGYSSAWLHHKGRNKHHYEYWLDPAHCKEPVEIPKKYIVEMFCDRVAASKTYRGNDYKQTDPISYLVLKRRKEQFLMNAKSYKILHILCDCLALYGEDYVCKRIREWLKGATNF